MKRAARKPSPERSAIMRAVKSRDTAPELAVRKLLRAIRAGLPAASRRPAGQARHRLLAGALAIFVHGCFWHGHDCARGARMPKTNAAYWRDKIARNRARDAAHLRGAGGAGLAGAGDLRMRAEGPGGVAGAPWRGVCIEISGGLHRVMMRCTKTKVSSPGRAPGRTESRPCRSPSLENAPLGRTGRQRKGCAAARGHPPARAHSRRHRARAGGRRRLRLRRAHPAGLDPLPPRQRDRRAARTRRDARQPRQRPDARDRARVQLFLASGQYRRGSAPHPAQPRPRRAAARRRGRVRSPTPSSARAKPASRPKPCANSSTPRSSAPC